MQDVEQPVAPLDDEVVSTFVSNSFSNAPPPSPTRKKRRHVPRSFRKAQESALGDLPNHKLLESLIEARYENQRLRSGLTTALGRIRDERVLTDTAYAFSEELIERIRRLHSQRAALKGQVIEATEALERWRIEYSHVRGRVEEGERLIHSVRSELAESVRREEEARRVAWRAERDLVEREAIAEGRRQGMLDGYARAVKEVIRRRDAAYAYEPEDDQNDETEQEQEQQDDDEQYDEPRFNAGRTETDRSSFYALPPVTADPPPIVPQRGSSNSPPRPVTPAVEHWSTDVPPPAPPSQTHSHAHDHVHTPPDNLIPTLDPNGRFSMAPPHEFANSMRASSPNYNAAPLPSTNDKGKGRAYARSDSTTISNLPITQDRLTHESTPIGINVEPAPSTSRHPSNYAPSQRSHRSSRVPPASQFQLSRTDEWDQSMVNVNPTTYPTTHVQPYCQKPDGSRPYFAPIPPDSDDEPTFHNPDITPFDAGITPSIRQFERLPRSRVNSVAGSRPTSEYRSLRPPDGHSVRSGRSTRSKLSVANPDPPSPRLPSQYRQSQFAGRAPSPRPGPQYAMSQHLRSASTSTHPGVAGIGAGMGPTPTSNLDDMLDAAAGNRTTQNGKTLHRTRSSLSQRTQGRYDHFSGNPADDPAIWGARV